MKLPTSVVELLAYGGWAAAIVAICLIAIYWKRIRKLSIDVYKALSYFICRVNDFMINTKIKLRCRRLALILNDLCDSWKPPRIRTTSCQRPIQHGEAVNIRDCTLEIHIKDRSAETITDLLLRHMSTWYSLNPAAKEAGYSQTDIQTIFDAYLCKHMIRTINRTFQLTYDHLIDQLESDEFQVQKHLSDFESVLDWIQPASRTQLLQDQRLKWIAYRTAGQVTVAQAE